MMYIIETALELGFLYALVPLALFLSYRVLDIADLTTDGSFVLGCAVSVSVAAGGHPFLAIPMAIAAGIAAGFVTAFLQTRMGVPSILAGIITNTGLYTINLMAMGWRANVSLLKQDTIFTIFKDAQIVSGWHEVIVGAVVAISITILLIGFLKTGLGLSIRATGDNVHMVSSSSINPKFTITIGLCIANGLTALSGALVGQAQKTADINSGTGIVVIGLACLVIGETIVGRKKMAFAAFAAVIGSIIYRLMYAIVLMTGVVQVEGLKLATAVIVAVAIAAPTIKEQMAQRKNRLAAR